MKDQETLLEVGFVLAGIGLAAAVGVLLWGKSAETGRRARRHAEPAPVAGSVEPERHQHISTVAAR